MGIIKSLLESRAHEQPLSGLNDPALVEYLTGGRKTAAGVAITEANALRVVAVYICVSIISESVASLPHFVYERLANGGKERATRHPLYTILHDRWNPFMTAFEAKETMQAHLLTWGNAFAEIERNGAGQVVNLWPWRPDRVRMEIIENEVWYFYRTFDGTEEGPFSSRQILHLRGLGNDGLVGYSVISFQREMLGLAKASEEYRARFFANDGRPGGVLQHPAKLSDAAYQRLQHDWRTRHEGMSNRGRVAILEEGMQWHDVGVPPDDAQFIQGQEFEASQIAALYRVPPYRVGVLKPGTVSFASTEQQDLDFVKHGIRPWLVRWETRSTLQLLSEGERRRYFTEFLVDALLRGDSASRQQALQTMRQNGIINADEWRAIENMNPLPGEEGKVYLVNGNMIPAKAAAEKTAEPEPAPPPPPAPGNGLDPDEITANALREMLKGKNGHVNGAAEG